MLCLQEVKRKTPSMRNHLFRVLVSPGRFFFCIDNLFIELLGYPLKFVEACRFFLDKQDGGMSREKREVLFPASTCDFAFITLQRTRKDAGDTTKGSVKLSIGLHRTNIFVHEFVFRDSELESLIEILSKYWSDQGLALYEIEQDYDKTAYLKVGFQGMRMRFGEPLPITSLPADFVKQSQLYFLTEEADTIETEDISFDFRINGDIRNLFQWSVEGSINPVFTGGILKDRTRSRGVVRVSVQVSSYQPGTTTRHWTERDSATIQLAEFKQMITAIVDYWTI